MTTQTPHSQIPTHETADNGNPAHRACIARCSAATIYLMSKYAQSPSRDLACAIAEQLRWISLQPQDSIDAALRRLAQGLLPRWQTIAAARRGITH